MKDFLKKIKLIDHVIFELNCTKSDFIKKFNQNVEYSNLNFTPFESFEAFSSSRFEYKGNINSQRFQIRKKRKLFDGQQTFATATGSFVENIDQLIIKAEINSFRKQMWFFLAFIFFFLFGIYYRFYFCKP